MVAPKRRLSQTYSPLVCEVITEVNSEKEAISTLSNNAADTWPANSRKITALCGISTSLEREGRGGREREGGEGKF